MGQEVQIGCSDQNNKFFVFCSDCDLEGIESSTEELAVSSYLEGCFAEDGHDRMSFSVVKVLS